MENEGFDEDMEYEDDDEAERVGYEFSKRFLAKKKKLNNGEVFLIDDEVSQAAVDVPLEESLANLSLTDILTLAKSPELTQKLEGIIQIRKLVSGSGNPPSDILTLETVDFLAECLNLPNPEIQLEAAWALTNIACYDPPETQHLFEFLAISTLMKLLGSDCEVNLANQVLWAIGNALVKNPRMCYYCLSSGIMTSLTNQMTKNLADKPFLRTLSWVMVNICKVKDHPLFRETAYDALIILYELVKQQDDEIVLNSIWSMAYLTDNGLDALVEFDRRVIKYVVPHLASTNPESQAAALRLLANLASGDDDLTNKLIQCGALNHLKQFFNHPNEAIKQEAAWMISNILAGNEKQVEAVFKAGLIPEMINLLDSDVVKTQVKAVWAITNIPLCGAPHHLKQLLDLIIIPRLTKCLKSRPYVAESAVEGIKLILEKSEARQEEIRQKLIACGALEDIKRLQTEGNKRAKKHAEKIILEYFSE